TQTGIVVTPASLVSLAVAPASGTLKVGQVQPYTATGTYADSTTADLTRAVKRTREAASTATVDASGKVAGKSAGSAHITALQGGVSGQATVTVSAPTPIGIALAPAPVSRPGSAGTTPPSGTPPAPLPIPTRR